MATDRSGLTRREALGSIGKLTAATVVAGPLIDLAFDGATVHAQTASLNAVAGVDRVVMANGRTYLSAWTGYGDMPRRGRSGRGGANAAAVPAGPAPTVTWTKVSGPGAVTFADAGAASTTATFGATGEYVLAVTADNGMAKTTSEVRVKVEPPPPAVQLTPVVTTRHAITSPLWHARTKTLITEWIPHCITQIERTDLVQGPNSGAGGIDNFIEAAKALRGEPHAAHKGYVFSNAWVHQTVEAMSLAMMVDAAGDQAILDAQAHMRATLDRWIPVILAAQHPDGYLHTAFTLRDMSPNGGVPAASRGPWLERWSASHRGNHEGYVAGYFIESAINHFQMTGGKDRRLYDAAKKLADCWANHIGPASAKAPDGTPKQAWFDGHQEMEQALVRFGKFVNEVEVRPGATSGPGDRYIALAKFLLDCREGGSEYDQSHLPVTRQYEAVGHAVRAVYTYSGMADVAVETHDVDYQSAVKSLWDNIVHRKYYVTGGVASGETSEGFGPDYSLRNNSYCEACSSCGEIFFQWKMHLAYHDAQYADLYEQTLYNALLGSLALDGTRFYYTNPLDANAQRTTWHSCPCCVGNLSRTMLMLPTWTYSRADDGVYVNLFVGSDVTVPGVAGTDVQLVQETNYPWDGRVALTVNPSASKRWALRIRAPKRDVSALYRAVPAADGLASLRVNGRAITPAQLATDKGYLVIDRTWAKGDRVEFELPLPVQRVYASEKIEANRGRVALRRGPVVYNIEQVDQDIHQRLDTSAPLTAEWRGDLLSGVTVIRGRFADGTPMTAIPNYARFNRDPIPPPPAPVPPPVPGAPPAPRPTPPPATSIVWMKE